MIDHARKEAQQMVDALLPWAQQNIPIVGLEPSCLLTLRDEYKVLIPGDATNTVAAKALLIEELLVQEHKNKNLHWNLHTPVAKVLVHGHCHQKALNAFSAVQETLALIPELEVEIIESSCCGMAGAFGYARETANVSIKMAELDLLPAVRKADEQTLIVADGTSCRHQIDLGSEREALHVVEILAMALSKPGAQLES